MRKLLPILLGFALAFGVANAQNITKSLQGSQDPRGPVGEDSSNNMYFPNHINTFGGTVPTMGACFTGTVSSNSFDNAGTLTTGGGTTCQLTFGTAFNVPPHCVFNSRTVSPAVTPIFTTVTTGVNMTNVTSTTVYDWICLGY